MRNRLRDCARISIPFGFARLIINFLLSKRNAPTLLMDWAPKGTDLSRVIRRLALKAKDLLGVKATLRTVLQDDIIIRFRFLVCSTNKLFFALKNDPELFYPALRATVTLEVMQVFDRTSTGLERASIPKLFGREGVI